MKDQKHYDRLVSGEQTKKINKILETADPQELELLFNAYGRGASGSDPIYNQLVVQFQTAKAKPVKLAAIRAMGMSGRSAAVSQLGLFMEQNQDPELDEAAKAAIHALKSKA